MHRARQIIELIAWFWPKHVWVRGLGLLWIFVISLFAVSLTSSFRSVRVQTLVYHVLLVARWKVAHCSVSTALLTAWEGVLLTFPCLNRSAFLVEEYWLLFPSVFPAGLLSYVLQRETVVHLVLIWGWSHLTFTLQHRIVRWSPARLYLRIWINNLLQFLYWNKASPPGRV